MLLGRYKINKNKLGPIGWRHKYRVSNKIKSLLYENKHRNKNSKIEKQKSILEVIDYTDDEDVPFCEDFSESGDDLNAAIALFIGSGNKEKEKVDDNTEDRDDKPKVGWEFKYRISKFLNENKKSEAKTKKDVKKNISQQQEIKPKVGWEYKYRVSNMLAHRPITEVKASKRNLKNSEKNKN